MPMHCFARLTYVLLRYVLPMWQLGCGGIASGTILSVNPGKSTSATTLSKVPIFSGLEENELDFLVQRAVPRQCGAGEIIFNEGEPCSGLYVVQSGHVRIFKSSSSGREQVLSIDGPGSSVAELPVFE